MDRSQKPLRVAEFLTKWRGVILLAALVGYYLPWLVSSAAALTSNAFDLAEFVSLNPAVRDGSIPFLAPFLLRAALGGLALLFCVRALEEQIMWRQVFFAAAALALAITLMPPLDFFFKGEWADTNYRQQFLIATWTLAGLVALTYVYRRGLLARIRVFEMAVAGLSMIGSVIGEILALNAVHSLDVAAPLGVGVVVFVVCLGLVLVSTE